ncbi:MAG TPA: DNA-protecting protein DprA [Nocardioides bacterium]|uniref:DNA-processing protein DprA n=1 Tax=uncultured Nocardioides sp. TaxID=198441 RepID=UPI000ED4F919|nr:DNA-processing protein DprA [uncultured Nocardioides sp.]HCB06286.1 DNA-protecting protein DprA [Nocardioides sp.]
MSAERLARLALSRLGEPGDLRLAHWVTELGAVQFHDALRAGAELDGLNTELAARLPSVEPERDLERASRLGIRWIVPGDAEWPAALDDLEHVEPLHRMGRAPLGLWVRGPLRLHELPTPVAVVGARSATTYGTDVATELAAGLARAGSAVISGAAYGIDQAAHRGALAGDGPTVAVLACGVDRAYPSRHKPLLDHLADHGAVVSELAPGCSPTRPRFLARNRVIAALSLGTVVVEAAVRSGALNTANWASGLNRPVMGVPGPVTSAPSEGVHQLIRSGAASLVTRATEVLELTRPAGEHLVEPLRAPSRPRDLLGHDEQRVLEAVPLVRPAPPESVARTAGLGLVEVRASLVELRRRGLVEELPTGWRLADDADQG